MNSAVFEIKTLEKLFPFCFVTNAKGQILTAGQSFYKLNPNIKNKDSFFDFYNINSPSETTFENIKKDHLEKMVILQEKFERHQLMGQVIKTKNKERYIFFVNLFINDISLLSNLKLTYSDFAVQDPVFDFLMLLQTHQRAIKEADQFNRKLAEAIDIANKASLLKSQFLANMSHELRTPMNGVLGMAGVLAETELTEDQKEYVSCIVTSGESMLALVNDILDLSKIEAGYVQLDHQQINLEDIIKDVTNILKITMSKKNLYLKTQIQEDVDWNFMGDYERIKQIILNFLGNAVKFTQTGGITLELSLLNQTSESSALQFRIIDTGIGMTEETLKKIFNPFVQGDSSTTKKFGGTGLGLSICKKLVQAMGGHIEVQSKVGDGTTFSFVLVLNKNLNIKLKAAA